MRASQYWEAANRKAAEFWTESVKTVETVEDALRAFEAYYHYVEIQDFDLACSVIIQERNTRRTEPRLILGILLNRFGLVQQTIFAMNIIINNITPGYNLGRLYNILGNFYQVIGNTHRNLEYQDKSMRLANELDLPKLKRYVLMSVGFCQIDRGEFPQSLEAFITCNLTYKDTEYYAEYVLHCSPYVAFLKSGLSSKEEAYELAKEVDKRIEKKQLAATGYRLFFLGLTYKNLGDANKSLKIYRRSIFLAEETYNIQVKGKVLSGIAEIYREQGEFETALLHHSEAIELLDKIGAKCDLAEACYQLGLTYQKMGEAEKSQENFDKAIQLFSEMEAPKQVEKVRRAMEAEG